ncbi:hypothetical protein Lal_00007126 [Lupinus albus]|nr:hypothetical protein Lal_00007126 [Lupinus albus]
MDVHSLPLGTKRLTQLPSCTPGGITGTPLVRPLRSSRTRSSSFKSLAPAMDRDRTVSRRSEPSSRTTLMGEQPNPWDLLQPQDVMSRHRGAKPPRRYGLLGEISLLSPGQAPFCLCTLRAISVRAEGTFGRLRYSFGGDRPVKLPA